MSSPAWAPMGADVWTPRAWWPLDEPSGTAIRDASGYDHVGTLQGGVSWGRDGPKPGTKAIEFDGVNGRAEVPASTVLDLAAAWSLAAWVYPTAVRAGTGSNAAGIISKGYSTILSYCLMYGQEGTEYVIPNNSLFTGFYSGSWRSVHDPTPLALNTWAHVCSTFDGATLRVYRNGVQTASKAASGNAASPGQGVYIGRRWDTVGGGPYFPGRIADARIYSRAITAAEVLALYNAAGFELGAPLWVPTT